MARIALGLKNPSDLALLKATGWRIAPCGYHLFIRVEIT
jgi:hypothetical protein